MNRDAYTSFAEKVQTQMQTLDYEEQLGILMIVVSAMNQKKKPESKMSKEETMRLFNKFTGSLKVPKDFDAKKEDFENSKIPAIDISSALEKI